MILLPYLFAVLASAIGEFRIDYEHDTFEMDGKPFRYVSGSMHYFRCPRLLWRDRLKKMRDAGLNAVSTYVEWSQHEKVPEQYDFSGELDIVEFIKIAAEEGLYVILRPGPYICAERDMGGLPPWLLQDTNIQLRTSDPRFTGPVQRWMDVLLPLLSPLLHGNNGPIIMVQVENEYGSYWACDKKYLIWLRDLFRRHVENKAVLFTTDGAGPSYLKCGKIPGVYATVDYGPEYNLTYAFSSQKLFEPRGPLVNSEYYPGWLTHWGEPRAVVNSSLVAHTLRRMLRHQVNVNFYMFHGGTNFGFTAGANMGSRYQSDITSYDYDAPLTEAGDLTQKYHLIKKVISEFMPLPSNSTIADIAPKGDYGQVNLVYIANLLSPKVRELLGRSVQAAYPVDFENLGSYFGYTLYETQVSEDVKDRLKLEANDIRDRGVVLLNGERVATFSREHRTYNATIPGTVDAQLSVLVENLGRINYGTYNNDTKGLGNVTLNGKPLIGWTMTSFPLDSITHILNCTNECLSGQGFRFYAAKFILPGNKPTEHLADTFIDVSHLKKGLVFINNHNLGRYWTRRGPQLSLYVPGVWLNKPPLENEIVVFEEKVFAETISLRFEVKPIWNSRQRRAHPEVSLLKNL